MDVGGRVDVAAHVRGRVSASQCNVNLTGALTQTLTGFPPDNAGLKRHCFTASTAESFRYGRLHTTRVFSTRPSLSMRAWISTVPETAFSRAAAGYSGAILSICSGSLSTYT